MHSAISIFGTDRPGIIATLTSRLANEGINIEDASMTLLQGHFAMILVVDLKDSSHEEIEKLLDRSDDLNDLTITFSKIDASVIKTDNSETSRYVFHLSVNDKPGIVASVTEVLARHNANVVDCSTRKNNETDVFTMVLDVDIPISDEDSIVDELIKSTNQYSGDVVFQRMDEVDL